ncbi:MAG: response regulator transcription factor [Thermodesulfovibrionales bacterium]|nr:response regulator transcription factor [Thermodesulfovibrionales bacterium]
MIKILIADDHALFREGIKQILSDYPDINVVAEAKNGNEALELTIKHLPNIVLLDISMPGMTGLEALKLIKNECKSVSVIILSMYPEEQYAMRALKSGASGYLTKSSAPEELIEAIRKTSIGGKYITASIAERIAYHLDEQGDKVPHEQLSNREYQILCMIASGKTVSRIAEELNLSVKTVSTYRIRILEKMNLKSNAELTNYAIKNNLVCF